MTYGTQGRSNRGHGAPADLGAQIAAFPVEAEAQFGIPRAFVAEAIRSRGLVGLTIRPRGEANFLRVFGGAIATDGTTSIFGDTIVNNWTLPSVTSFDVVYDADSAEADRYEAVAGSLDVSTVWLRTAEQLRAEPLVFDERGGEDYIAVTREGFARIARTSGHSAIGACLRDIESQLYPHPTPVV